MSIATQKAIVKFLRRYPGWHTFHNDLETTENVCAACNLGIAEINDYRQMRLKSAEKADRWLASFDS